MPRTVHVDAGKQMQGGQWQVLYLVERLPRASLLAPAGSPLLAEARKRGLDAEELSLPALLRAARPAGLIHAHDARAHTLAASAAGVPLVVSRRVGFPIKTSFGSRWKYSRPAMYLAVSKFAAGRLKEAGVPQEKVRVVYDGVPLPALGRPEPGNVLALAGKCTEIIEAAGELLNIPIHFTSNLWENLSTASVFLYVSEMEGLGSAALAAMAAGVPVIASPVGGLPEIVEHERTGLLLDSPVTAGQLAALVRRLLNDPVRAVEMGRNARERVEREFSVEAMVEATLRAYEEVLR